MKMSNLPIGTRLGGAFATVLLLTGLMLAVAVLELRGMSAMTQPSGAASSRVAEAAHTAIAERSARAQWILVLLGLSALAVGGIAAVAITRSVTRPLAGAIADAERIAANDLREPVAAPPRDDEIGALQRALAKVHGSLSSIAGDIRQGTVSLAHTSGEIASAGTDLSTRTEQTASALQRTASAMEEITAAVGQSAESTRTANQLVASANEVAQRGGAVVCQVVQTMGDIDASSKKIADIIGTIDGIAFQTNILALNAAVEAARAGEQGRGFAVVASEVRSLAQRSADAAREIKTLISGSVDKVENGTRLVTEAGQTMGEIVAAVQRVADIIGEVRAAADEQARGITEVNAAVADLDAMTQQNAALVEETAAAAESMKEQSSRLAALVHRFQLADRGSLAPATATPARAPVSTPVSTLVSTTFSTPTRRPAPAAVPPHPASKPSVTTASAPPPRPAVQAPAQPASRASAPAPAPRSSAPAPAAATAAAGDDWTTF